MPMSQYEQYVEAETAAGREPLERNQWQAERMKAGRAAKAAEREAVADEPEPVFDLTKPAEPLKPEQITHLNFCAPHNRFLTEVMQAGGRTVIDGSMAVREHVTIEFTEYHWVADLSDPSDKRKAEWLLKCKDFQTGKIVLVPAVAPPKQVAIQTGPRTSMSAQRGNEQVAPVQPPPNIAAALSASLTD